MVAMTLILNTKLPSPLFKCVGYLEKNQVVDPILSFYKLAIETLPLADELA